MNRIRRLGKTTFSSLGNRNFRLYFTGQLISQCGSWMQTIAQDWLVLSLTNSGLQLGLITALQFLPVLLFAPFGGVIADRFPKRKLIYITQIAFGLLALGLGTLVLIDAIQLWMLYIFAFVFGIINAADKPIRQTFMHEMVEQKHLHNAVSLTAVQFNVARIVGPALAGALIAVVGIGVCFIINGASFIAVIISLLLMKASDLNVGTLVPKAKGQLMLGLKYIFHTPALRDSLIIMTIVGTFSYEFNVSLPLLAKFTFHGNADSYAALTSALGAGAVIGGLYSASRKVISSKQIHIGVGLFGVSMLIASLAPSMGLMMCALVMVGAVSINLISIANTYIQLKSTSEMRGRVMAMWAVAVLGTTPIGGPIVGLIGERFGPRWCLVVGGVAALVASIYGFSISKVGKNNGDE